MNRLAWMWGTSLVLVAAAAAPAWAARVEGEVRDREGGKAIAGARVTVVGAERTVAADAQGRFVLDGVREGAWPLKVEAPGYLPLVVPSVSFDDRRAVELHAKLRRGVVKAATTVVAADRPSRLAQTETSRRSFTAEEVTRIAGARSDPILAVANSAGVSSSGMGGQLNIRGGGSGDNRYYIDNIQIGNPFHFGGLVSVFNANTLSKVDLYAGALPARFGNVKSAVLDIETRPPKSDAIHAVLEGNLLYSEGLIEGPIAPGLSFSLAGRRSYFDLFLGPFLPAFTVFPRFWDLQGKLSSDLPGGGKLDYLRISSQDALSVVLPGGQISRGVGSLSLDQGYTSQGLTWRQPMGEGASNRVTLSYQEPYADLRVGTFLSILSNHYWWTMADDAAWQLNDQHQLRAGLRYDTINYLERRKVPQIPPGSRRADLTADDVDQFPVRYTDTTGNQKIYGAYLEDAYKPFDALTLSLGARYDQLSTTGENKAAPRLGATWRSDSDTTWRLAYGQQFQFPDVGQMLPGMGNTQLAAPFSRDYVAGVDRQIADSLFGRLELYHRDLLFLIASDPTAVSTNLGAGRSDGLELTLDLQNLNGWNSQLALTLSRTTRTGPDRVERAFDSDQPVIANLLVSTPTLWEWSPSLRLRYSSGTPYTPIVDRAANPDGTYRPINGETNSARYPDGILWSARAERPADLFGCKGKFYFEVTQQHEAMAADYGRNYEKIGHPDINWGIPAIPYFGYQLRF